MLGCSILVTVALVVSDKKSSSPSPAAPRIIDSPLTPNPVVLEPPPTDLPHPPPTARPRSPPLTSRPSEVAGVGWVLAADFESCSAACSAAGGVCNAAGNDRVNDTAKVRYVAETMLGLLCGDTVSATSWHAAPFVRSDRLCRYQTGHHDCSSANNDSDTRLMCCCSADFADCPVSATEAARGWVLAADFQSCRAACTAVGGACHATGNDRVNDTAKVKYVAETVLGLTCEASFPSDWFAAPYFNISASGCGYQSNYHHDCSISTSRGTRNMCCCSADLADCPVSSAAPNARGWVLATENESCHATCAAVGGACNVTGINWDHGGGIVRYVAQSMLGLNCAYIGGSPLPAAPFFDSSIRDCRYPTGSNNHDCSSTADGYHRMCCCSDDCPVGAWVP